MLLKLNHETMRHAILACACLLLAATSANAAPMQPPDSPLPEPYGRVEGQVIDPAGKPMQYISLTLLTSPAGSVAYQTNADDRGQFVFDDVVPGTYTLRTFGPEEQEICNDCEAFNVAPGQTVSKVIVSDPSAKPGDPVKRLPESGNIEAAAGQVLFVAIFSAGSQWGDSGDTLDAHLSYQQELAAKDALVMAGSFSDTTGGMMVFKAASLADARGIVTADPAIEAGVLSFTLHEWQVRDTPAGR
jgi:uncharacterized protein YciI